ncbi:MAG: aldehyde ferredoxin oxidoreductase family protein [Rhodospirillales bacterium]|jgi:aldehyde:ferredoxin oxidoreductase|nr:aldehyde ferredoxin oxidoreductase family protein [Rhodospirillales bacterium]
MNGYHDRLAWIDLTSGTVEVRPIGEEDLANFIGGSALGAAILARLTDGNTKPLDPENPLIMMTGPFTATKIPAGSRHAVIGLSPLTGIYCDSSSGGSFGRSLKNSGFDGLVFTGKATKPIALVIDGDKIEIVDADKYWGNNVFDCADLMVADFGKQISTAVIGQAGENLVPMACIAHDGRHTRFAGRGGMGALMGSKMLKAVIIKRGEEIKPPMADEAALDAAIKELLAPMKEKLKMFTTYGTPGSLPNFERLGNLPINNWRDARAGDISDKINGMVMAETIQVKRSGCRKCPLLCARVVEVKDGPYKTDGISEAPEYETLGAFGSLQMVDSLEGIARANELCNNYGMDTISVGATIAFANECYEKGVITKEDTDGLELGFGQPDTNIELVRRMALGEGKFGKLLAQGSRKAAKAIGNGAEEYSVDVKGLEFPMHDPRFSWGHALGYATGARGACHLTSLAHAFEIILTLPEAGHDEVQEARNAEGKAQFVNDAQNLCVLRDALVACNFSMLNNAAKLTDFMNWYNMITGRGVTMDEFLQIGARGFALKRMIINRYGMTRKDDDLPPRMRTLKKVGEDINFDVPPLYPMLSEYYDIRGWTEEGRVSGEMVSKLELEEFA